MNVQIIFSIIGALIALIAVVLIYNARKIVKERFSFGDQNSGALIVKTTGMFISKTKSFFYNFSSVIN